MCRSFYGMKMDGRRVKRKCANNQHFKLWNTHEVQKWAHPKPAMEIVRYFIQKGMSIDTKKGKHSPPKYCQQCVDDVVRRRSIAEEQIASEEQEVKLEEPPEPSDNFSSTLPGPSMMDVTSGMSTSDDSTCKQSLLQGTEIFSDLGSKLQTVQSTWRSHVNTITHHAHSWSFGDPYTCRGHASASVHQQPPPVLPPEDNFPPPPPGWGRNTHYDSTIYYRLHSFPGIDPVINKSLTVSKDKTYTIRLFGRDVHPTAIQGLDIINLKTDIPKLLNHVLSMQLCVGYPDTKYKYKSMWKTWSTEKQDAHVFHDTFMCDSNVVKTTVRAVKCVGYVLGTGVRCPNCAKYGNTLRPAYKRHELKQKYVSKRIAAQSHVPIGSLSELEAKNRVRKYAKVKRNLTATVRRLRKRLRTAIEKEGEPIEPNMSNSLLATMKDHHDEIQKSFPDNTFGKLFWEEQMKAVQKKDKRGHRWHPMIIKWALNLRMASGKAYRTIRGSHFLELPHETTLKQYLHWTKPTSGFRVEAIEQLLREMPANKKPHHKYVTVIHDEMKVKSDLVFRKDTGELVGFTNLGDIQNNLRHYESIITKNTTSPEGNMAKYMLVFMVRGLFLNLQYPLAHFPTTNTKSDEIFALCWRAIEILELAGLHVVSVTCDGASTNRRFFDLHREAAPEQQQPTHRTPNPYQSDSQIYFMADPPHLIKCVRNAWESKTRGLWNNGPISWRVIKDMYHQRQGMRGFYLTKLTYEHVYLTTFSKMKVRLAAQVLSQTVANALPEVEAATKKFVLIFDKFFDVLNVRSRVEGIKKRKPNVLPYTSPEDERLKWLTGEFMQYLDDWDKTVQERGTYTKTEKAKMCIPQETLLGLRRSALSFSAAVKFLLKEEGVEFVLTEKFNQDKLEGLFGNTRQMRGGNDAPNVQQFNESMNAARLKSSQTMKVVGGNTLQRPDLLTIDNTPIPRRPRHSATLPVITE